MGSIFSLLRLLFSVRHAAKLRAEYPLLPLLVGIIVAQATAYLCPPTVATLLVIGPLAVAWRWGRYQSLLLGCSLGGVSIALLLVRPMIAWNEEGTYQGVVVDFPRFARAGEAVLQLRARPSGDSPGDGALIECRLIDLPWRSYHAPELGDLIQFRGRFRDIATVNPLSYNAYLARRGVVQSCKITAAVRVEAHPALIQKLRDQIAEQVIGVVGDSEDSGLLLSMAIGLDDQISLDTERIFQRCGVAHLLVVSGYQVGLVFIGCFWSLCGIVRWFVYDHWGSALFIGLRLISFFASVLFMLVSGVQGSSLRAVIALGVFLVSRCLERGSGMCASIVSSATIMSLIWPGVLFEVGTQLTFAALIGIAIGSQVAGGRIIKLLTVSWQCSLWTSAVSVMWFGSLSLVGFVVNPIVGPLASVLSCGGGALGVLMHWIGVDRQGEILHCVVRTLHWMVEILEWLSRCEFSAIEVGGGEKAVTEFLLVLLCLGHALRCWRAWTLRVGLYG